MSQDQRFFDIFTLVLGILMVISIGIYVLSARIGNATQGQYILTEENYQAEIESNIAPVGTVVMPGQEEIAAAKAAAAAAAPVATVLSGPQVYNAACVACHGAGVGGAPIYGDAAAWATRLEQGTETLYSHAINGYTGAAGYMPPKGGRLDLSDEEIQAAVDYMIADPQ